MMQKDAATWISGITNSITSTSDAGAPQGIYYLQNGLLHSNPLICTLDKEEFAIMGNNTSLTYLVWPYQVQLPWYFEYVQPSKILPAVSTFFAWLACDESKV